MKIVPNAKPGKNKKNLPLQYGLSIAFMLLVLYLTLHFILKGTKLSDIRASLLSANPWWVAAGFLCMFAHQFCVAEVLRLLLVSMVKVRPPWHVCRNTAYIGYYFNNITPSATGGQPMEIYYLYRCRVNLAGSSLIFISMTMFYNFVLLLFGSVMLIWQKDLILGSLYGIKYVLIYSYIFNVFLMFGCFALMYFPSALHRGASRLVGWLGRRRMLRNPEKKLDRLEGFFRNYGESSHHFWSAPGLLIKLLLLHMIQLSALYLVPFCAGMALGAGKERFLPVFALQSVLNLAASGFPTPGSVGIMESGFVTMFASVFPDGKVVSAMLLTRLINFYTFLIISALVTLYAFASAGSRSSRMRKIAGRREVRVPLAQGEEPAFSVGSFPTGEAGEAADMDEDVEDD